MLSPMRLISAAPGTPPVACALLARELPLDGSGDTWFLDLVGAYEAPPPGLKSTIARHRIFHDAGYTSAGTVRTNTTAGDAQ